MERFLDFIKLVSLGVALVGLIPVFYAIITLGFFFDMETADSLFQLVGFKTYLVALNNGAIVSGVSIVIFAWSWYFRSQCEDKLMAASQDQ